MDQTKQDQINASYPDHLRSQMQSGLELQVATIHIRFGFVLKSMHKSFAWIFYSERLSEAYKWRTNKVKE